MIATVRGTVTSRNINIDKGSAMIVIEAAGVGYEVVTTAATAEHMMPVGNDETLVHIHHHITEADQKLFGFASVEEKAAFKGLISAHGVGPSLGLAVLGTHSVPQLAAILESEDVDALCEVPGVGKKTAQRLLVELKASLVLPVIDGGTGAAVVDVTDAKTASGDQLGDVREALASLGYSQTEVRKALSELRANGAAAEPDSGELLKAALKALGS